MVDALHAARKAGHDAGLTIVGKEAHGHCWKREFVGTASRVSSILWAGRAIPLHILAQADVLLVPSRYEGYGLVIVEALAAGVPVIATDVGSLPRDT